MEAIVCHVCQREVLPETDGKIRYEGITSRPKGMAWVWGPVPVHEECRYWVKTPYDDQIGGAYKSTWERIAPA